MVDVMDRLDSLTDAELLGRTASDMEAFAAFYRRHVGWVLRVAARRTGSREHAGDLTAEVFAAAMLLRLSSGRTRIVAAIHGVVITPVRGVTAIVVRGIDGATAVVPTPQVR